ncbi:MAG: VanZ family protein [Chloroflexi bacterium]|nr:VanZ family protein [Chloroflexota bacterium]
MSTEPEQSHTSPQPDAPPPFFASARERRLWTWTLLIVAGIYATLGLTPILVGAIPQGVAAAGFLGAMLLVGLTILTQGLKVRPRGAEIGVALGIAVVYFMVFFRMTIPERSHLIEYSVLAVFIYEALMERARQGRRVFAPALLAIIATAIVGLIDEGIQAILPNRVFDARDILFNILAGIMAVTTMAALGWARNRVNSGNE